MAAAEGRECGRERCGLVLDPCRGQGSTACCSQARVSLLRLRWFFSHGFQVHSGLDARPACSGSFLIHPLLAYAAPSVCQTRVNETEVTPVLEELVVWGGRQLVKDGRSNYRQRCGNAVRKAEVGFQGRSAKHCDDRSRQAEAMAAA